MSAPASFAKHFHDRADLAEQLYRDQFRNEAHLVANVALDALSLVWTHDFPQEAPSAGGDAVRFRRFVQRFADDPQKNNVAVVLFAQDLIEFGPNELRSAGNKLLEERQAGTDPAKHMEFREWPHQHKDCDWTSLANEEPALRGRPELAEIAERYTYPALVYSFFRCGVAHTLLKGSRTHDFSGTEPDDEISYAPPMIVSGKTRPIGIKFGLKVVTGWLRSSVTNYVEHAEAKGVRLADDLDPSKRAQENLERAWRNLSQ